MKKILVIEDSEISLEYVKQALAGLFELHIAKSLKEGRRKIGNHRFDLCLFEINLPDGNGSDFYSEIVELGHKRCPVIFF